MAVLCDERKLKQVLLNLLSNAIKFTARGRISVAARRDGADVLRIEVADAGVGIAAKDIAKARTPFGQVDGTLSREHKGTGLGLPLAKQLIELHGGSLALASETGVAESRASAAERPCPRVIPSLPQAAASRRHGVAPRRVWEWRAR